MIKLLWNKRELIFHNYRNDFGAVNIDIVSYYLPQSWLLYLSIGKSIINCILLTIMFLFPASSMLKS